MQRYSYDDQGLAFDGLVMARVMEDIEQEKKGKDYAAVLYKKVRIIQLDEMSVVEKQISEEVDEIEDEKEREILMLEKRLSCLKRECEQLQSENKQLWKLYYNF